MQATVEAEGVCAGTAKAVRRRHAGGAGGGEVDPKMPEKSIPKEAAYQVIKLSASLSPPPFLAPPKPNPLSDSTRTVATVAFTLSKLFADALRSLSTRLVASDVLPSPDQLLLLQRGLFAAASPLFFAYLHDRPTGYLNTPLTVVVVGLAKWLDIYSGVLMVRVLLRRRGYTGSEQRRGVCWRRRWRRR